jgi:hypothetical protein
VLLVVAKVSLTTVVLTALLVSLTGDTVVKLMFASTYGADVGTDVVGLLETKVALVVAFPLVVVVGAAEKTLKATDTGAAMGASVDVFVAFPLDAPTAGALVPLTA